MFTAVFFVPFPGLIAIAYGLVLAVRASVGSVTRHQTLMMFNPVVEYPFAKSLYRLRTFIAGLGIGRMFLL